MYKTDDTLNVLPVDLHKRAIKFAREATGMQRPHKSHSVLIDAFRECFKSMQELGMVTEEFQNGKKESNRKG